MTESGFVPKFSRGQEVFARGATAFNGKVLGYIQRLSGAWVVVVETFNGNVHHISEDAIQLIKQLPPFVPSHA